MAVAGLATLGTIGSIASAGIGAYSSISQGNASAAQAEYQAQVAENNARIANANKERADDAGQAQALASDNETLAMIGAQEAAMSSSGISSGSRSFDLLRRRQANLGRQNALNIADASKLEARNFSQQASNSTAEAAMQRSAAKNNKTAGYIGAAGSLLGGASQLNWGAMGSSGKFTNLFKPQVSGFQYNNGGGFANNSSAIRTGGYTRNNPNKNTSWGRWL